MSVALLAVLTLTAEPAHGQGRPSQLIRAGLVETRAGNFDVAKQQFRAALQLDEDNAQAWAYLANAQKELGEYREADHSVNRSLAISPRYRYALTLKREIQGLAEGTTARSRLQTRRERAAAEATRRAEEDARLREAERQRAAKAARLREAEQQRVAKAARLREEERQLALERDRAPSPTFLEAIANALAPITSGQPAPNERERAPSPTFLEAITDALAPITSGQPTSDQILAQIIKTTDSTAAVAAARQQAERARRAEIQRRREVQEQAAAERARQAEILRQSEAQRQRTRTGLANVGVRRAQEEQRQREEEQRRQQVEAERRQQAELESRRREQQQRAARAQQRAADDAAAERQRRARYYPACRNLPETGDFARRLPKCQKWEALRANSRTITITIHHNCAQTADADVSVFLELEGLIEATSSVTGAWIGGESGWAGGGPQVSRSDLGTISYGSIGWKRVTITYDTRRYSVGPHVGFRWTVDRFRSGGGRDKGTQQISVADGGVYSFQGGSTGSIPNCAR